MAEAASELVKLNTMYLRIFFVVSCASLYGLFSHAQTTFNKVYDINNSTEFASNVIEVDDGYIFYEEGSYFPGLNGWRGMGVRKIDLSGNLQWTKTYGKTQQRWSSRQGAFLKLNNNISLVLGGFIYDSTSNDYDGLLIKFDLNGDTLWVKKYGGQQSDLFYAIKESNDAGLYLLGMTRSFGDINGDCYLVKTDSSGNEQWYNTFGNNGLDEGYSIDFTLDNNLVIGGGTEKFTPKPYAPWVIIADTSGNVEWDKNYGTQSGADCGATVISSKSGGSILFSCIDTFITNGPDEKTSQIVKIDSSGEVVWRKVFDNSKERIIYNSLELNNGDIMFTGLIRNDDDSRDVGWLFKLDSDGNEIWERKPEYIHPGPPNITQRLCYLYDVKETSDGGLVCVGSAHRVDSNDVSNQDAWVLKLDSMGCEIPSCHVGIDDRKIIIGEVVIMPNPTKSQALISIKSGKQEHAFKEAVFRLYDVAGKEIYTQTTTLNTSAYREDYLNTTTFQSGIYFYIVTTGNEVIGKGKVVKE